MNGGRGAAGASSAVGASGAARSWSAWRALARMARRELWRRKGRSALVVALVALPVGAAVGGLAAVREIRAGQEANDERRFGTAEVRLESWEQGAQGFDRRAWDRWVAEDLPAGSRAVTYAVQPRWLPPLGDGGRWRMVAVSDVPLDDPMTAPGFELLAGRPPATAGEVAVSASLAAEEGVALGDTLDVRFGRFTVVGIVRNRSNHDERWAVTTGAPEAVAAGVVAGDRRTVTLIDLPPPFDQSPQVWGALQKAPGGFEFAPGLGYQSPQSIDPAQGVLIAQGLLLAVVGIVVAAALSVGARRQVREHGLLQASGAAPGHLSAVVVAHGMWCGLLGSALGAVLGTAAFLVGRAVAADRVGSDLAMVGPSPGDVVAPVVLGTCAAMAAAWWPARAAAGTPVLAALAGRRPLPVVRTHVPALGVAALVLGCAFVGLGIVARDTVWQAVLVGGVMVLFGLVACSVWLVGRLDPLAAAARGLVRLAWRDLARQRGRVAPVVSAIMAVTAVLLAGSMWAVSEQAADQASAASAPDPPPDVVVLDAYPMGWQSVAADIPAAALVVPADAIDAVRAVVPGGVAATGWRLDVHTAWGVVEGGPDVLALMGVDTPELRAALAAGSAVSFLRLGGRDTLLLELWPDPTATAGASVAPETVEVAAVEADVTALAGPRIDVLVPVGTAERLGIRRSTGFWAVRAPAPLDADQRDALAEAFRWDGTPSDPEAVGADEPGLSARWWSAPADDLRVVVLVALVVAALAVLGVVAIGLTLTAHEARADTATLDALGAAPAARRRLAAVQAGTMTALGVLLAVPGGFAPTAIALVARPHVGPEVPWSVLAATLVALPVVAAAAAALATGWGRVRPARRI
jgi:putative ABC transport system permease protein